MKKAFPISLEYRGGTTKDGVMGAYTAAASMMAFSDLISIANQAIHGDKNLVQVKVRGFRGSSFDIDFVIKGLGLANTILSSGHTLPHLVDVLKESLDLWIFLKGEPPRNISNYGNGQQIENNYGDITQISNSVLLVVTDPRAGEAVHEFISKPLDAGVGSIAITDTKKDLKIVTKDQSNYFKPINIDRDVFDSNTRMHLIVESPTFKDGNKWKVFDGANTFNAAMLDDLFLQDIDTGRARFGKGDILDATVRTIQTQSIKGLKLNRQIVEVHGHEKPLKQTSLVN